MSVNRVPEQHHSSRLFEIPQERTSLCVQAARSGVAREGTGGDESPPVVLKTNFEIFLNLKRKVGEGGGGYDDSNF